MVELFGAVLKNWKTALVLVALVGGLVYAYILQSKLTEYATLNGTLTKQVTELQTTNTNMKDAYEDRINTFTKVITDQNNSIAAYKADVVRIQGALDTSNKKAADVRKQADADIQKILSEHVGQPGQVVSCQQAMKYLVDSAAELRWEPVK